jgi:hypothetical protein
MTQDQPDTKSVPLGSDEPLSPATKPAVSTAKAKSDQAGVVRQLEVFEALAKRYHKTLKALAES